MSDILIESEGELTTEADFVDACFFWMETFLERLQESGYVCDNEAAERLEQFLWKYQRFLRDKQKVSK